MKERPILFSGPMVRAILDGRKTMTRQIAPISRLIIKPHAGDVVTWAIGFSKPVKGVLGSYSGGRFSEVQARRIIASRFCPHGKPGDRLYVKETTVNVEEHDYIGPVYLESNDGRSIMDWGLSPAPDDCTEVEPHELKLRPASRMPKSMARIWLEVTGVRVERLQDISEMDAIAEGIDAIPTTGDNAGPNQFSADLGHGRLNAPTAMGAYRMLWEFIHGPSSWDANPFCWVIEFRRVS